MGMYDLEKEIYRILQDSSKIRGYNARLRNEYINLNDENKRLKVENSKLVSQNACTEISLAKAEADNFAKSEEVKSLQCVINLLTPGHSDKNNRSDSHVKGGLIGASHNEKNDISASSVIGTPDNPIQGESAKPKEISDSNSVNSKSKLLEPILPVNLANEVPIGDAEGTVKLLGSPIVTDELLPSIFTYSIIFLLFFIIILIIVMAKLLNTWKKTERYLTHKKNNLQKYRNRPER
ncbi:5212_t:CDS:1 [Funneliformis geosporum]|uniref:5173_t:CDS:1 n=1 Tax=Funneliformis geosporum TaxID=1117311 RepID=A0A9W4X4Y2_9GLOM|nr:5212_t:CDS:1 [Funneliformis geosporum]CAI2186891.1 5173_t:CDS:1 [Funneliformis geosporum]